MAMLVQELRTDVVAPTERWDLWQDFATRTHAPTLGPVCVPGSSFALLRFCRN